MSQRRFCLAILLFLFFGAAQLFSAEAIRVAIVDFSLNERSQKDAPVPFLDQVNEALRNGFENSPDFELIPAREVRREYDPLIARYRTQDDPLLFSLGRQLRADYVVTGQLSTENPNSYMVVARMLDIQGNRVLPPLSFEGTRRTGTTLMGNLVIRIASSLRQNFTPGQKSGMTEIAIDLGQITPPIDEKKDETGSGHAISLTVLIYGGVSVNSDLKSLSSLFGLDVLFDIEKSYFSFGFGESIMGKLTFDGLVFLEAHLYENARSVSTQMYFRVGGGLVIPIDPAWKRDTKVSALVGARHISSFVFDVGFGIDYFSLQRSAFCLRMGIGF